MMMAGARASTVDGASGSVDLVLIFGEMARIATNEPPGCFDCNDARIRVTGVVIPFETT